MTSEFVFNNEYHVSLAEDIVFNSGVQIELSIIRLFELLVEGCKIPA